MSPEVNSPGKGISSRVVVLIQYRYVLTYTFDKYIRCLQTGNDVNIKLRSVFAK